MPVPVGTVGSGNGTLDFLFFTESNGGAGNSSGPFNGDNANTQMPTGNGNTTSNESFITSIGELRAFYILNFPNGSGGSTVNQLVVMVDVNETGGPQTINLDTFDIIRNFTAFAGSDPRNAPFSNDITSSQQNATNATFSGGTVLANLDSSQKVLAQVSVGAGHADQAIFTGINPFDAAYADSDRVLLHWVSSDHDNGGETVFVSGSIASQDFVPEPASLGLLAAGGLLVSRRARRR
ncbi:MAG: PEP-CTERM sorting domain-containing protein [Anaerolineae bacterium]|nr:PEP-CTERM sorting domain-containing protein [Phycisphaerae bacterium]